LPAANRSAEPKDSKVSAKQLVAQVCQHHTRNLVAVSQGQIQSHASRQHNTVPDVDSDVHLLSKTILVLAAGFPLQFPDLQALRRART
jgi:hypothetical protein